MIRLAAAFGKTLLHLCEISDLCILNGCAPGQTNGRMTCNTAQGLSVVDYFLTSARTVYARTVYAIAVLDKCAESHHCPLTLELMLQASAPRGLQIDGYSDAPSTVSIDKIKYDESKRDAYRENLLTLLDSLFIDPDPQCCLASALQSCIAQAALTSFGRPCKHSMQKVNQNWYDAECKSARAA